jgi:hypothetical protein
MGGERETPDHDELDPMPPQSAEQLERAQGWVTPRSPPSAGRPGSRPIPCGTGEPREGLGQLGRLRDAAAGRELLEVVAQVFDRLVASRSGNRVQLELLAHRLEQLSKRLHRGRDATALDTADVGLARSAAPRQGTLVEAVPKPRFPYEPCSVHSDLYTTYGLRKDSRSLDVVEHAGIRLDVEYEERYWYPDDGGVVWIAGYHVVDRDSGRYLARDAPELAARGLRVIGVAGAGRHHADALASDGVAPGRPLELRRDPDNPHDPNAIAVHDAGGEQVGWVPRELAAELAPELDAGRAWSAVVLREQRRSPRDPRHGLTMLLGRTARIELVPARG